MEVIYADEKRRGIGVLKNYDFDIAFGKDENDFCLQMSLPDHCCKEGYFIYIPDTEYGGIVDRIKPDTKNDTISYEGRSWHGILNKKVIEPRQGEDYYIVSGDANEILRTLVKDIGLNDLFDVDTETSGIWIQSYQFNRYCFAYDGIRKMLYENDAKLKLYYDEEKVFLSAIPLYDYSEDEEWDTSQMDFSIEKEYRPTNHLICLGKGDLKERCVIHLFTDQNGGVMPYSFVDRPYRSEHYILDKRNQVLFGDKEITEIYDCSGTQDTTNYIMISQKPSGWIRSYTNYYYKNEDSFEQLQQTYEDVFSLLSEKPPDWDSSYNKYYRYDGGGYSTVDGVESETYKVLEAVPCDWALNYRNYFYYWSDGLSVEYKTVESITKEEYRVQTAEPSDWQSSFTSYYKKVKVYVYVYTEKKKLSNGVWRIGTVIKNKKVENQKTSTYRLTFKEKIVKEIKIVQLSGDCPKWEPKKYYTKVNVEYPPEFRANYYYEKIITITAPEFNSGTYYSSITREVIPEWKTGTYYNLYTDHYAELVRAGVEKLAESYNCDKISSSLEPSIEYDINDIVGASEKITGIRVSQPITKKILKIQDFQETITYEIGE